MLYESHHTVLWSATGLGSTNSKLEKDGFVFVDGLRLRFLCRVRVRTSDFRFAARTFLARIFWTHCPWICWNDMSSKYRCKLILGWKLETVVGSYSSPFFLRAFKQISTKSGQARTQVSFQFSRFHTISFNVAETSVISVAVLLFVLSSFHFSVGW